MGQHDTGSNVLIQLIDAGKIASLEELKGTYRQAVMKTHPDAVGSDRYLEGYLALSNQYEEAKAYLFKIHPANAGSLIEGARNHRLAFFQQLQIIEALEMPYAFHPEENRGRLKAAKAAAHTEIAMWDAGLGELYKKADQEYVRIKTEKPMGPYLKHALALNIRPVFHDIIAFHLTGKKLYAKQAKQNRSGIMNQLEQRGLGSLREFLSFLIENMENGPAVLD